MSYRVTDDVQPVDLTHGDRILVGGDVIHYHRMTSWVSEAPERLHWWLVIGETDDGEPVVHGVLAGRDVTRVSG